MGVAQITRRWVGRFFHRRCDVKGIPQRCALQNDMAQSGVVRCGDFPTGDMHSVARIYAHPPIIKAMLRIVHVKSASQLAKVRALLLDYQALLPTLTLADGVCP